MLELWMHLDYDHFYIIFGALFQKSVLLANTERRPKFLEYTLTSSISR